jgi:hypothetical protein
MSDATEATTVKMKAGKSDLDGLSLSELASLRDAAKAKRIEKLEAAKKALVEETRAKVAELGLSMNQVFLELSLTGGKSEPELPVKLLGPNGEAWSGRGGFLNGFRVRRRKARGAIILRSSCG